MIARWSQVLLLICGLSVGAFTHAQAQDEEIALTCPVLVVTALETAETACGDLPPGSVCYGNLFLEAEPLLTDESLMLDAPGDQETVSRIRSIQLSAMDVLAETWGIAVMDVLATTQEAEETSNLTIVLFGDAAISNAVVTLPVTTTEDANIRLEPSTRTAVVDVAAAGQALLADSITADGEWIRVRKPSAGNEPGWIVRALIEDDVDLSVLTPIDELDEEAAANPYNAMQAFYFQAAPGDAPCDEAPDSGMLLQTPEGVAEFTLLLNEVNIQLESTAYVQAAPAGEMTVFAVEGNVTVEVDGERRVAVPGTQIGVPLDESGAASGPPSPPEAYDADSVASLPVTLLADQINIAPPRDLPANAPLEGEWGFQWGIDQETCPDGRMIDFTDDGPSTSLRYAEDGESLLLLLTRYRRTGTGSYEAVFTDTIGNLHRNQLTVTGPDRLTGSAEITYIDNDCTLTVPFSMSLTAGSN